MITREEHTKERVIQAALAWYEDVRLYMEAWPDLPHCESLTADNLFKAVTDYKKKDGEP